MDEIWQRYRPFFVPVLIGVGVFLVGLIVVQNRTPDPAIQRLSVKNQNQRLERKVKPTDTQIANLQRKATEMQANVAEWAGRLDPAGAEDSAAQERAVALALQAAILRGADPAALERALRAPTSPQGRALLAAFAGDGVAAETALEEYREVLADRLDLLRTRDPNVGFTRLLDDVWSSLRVRANRADVEIRSDRLGFGRIKSVTRATLLQRVLDLSLVAQVVDLAVRSGVRSVDQVQLESDAPAAARTEADDARGGAESPADFLRQWGVTFTLQGDMAALQPVLAFLTDPARPLPLSHATLDPPPKSSPLEGFVRLEFKAYSVRVRADASLGLEAEDQR